MTVQMRAFSDGSAAVKCSCIFQHALSGAVVCGGCNQLRFPKAFQRIHQDHVCAGPDGSPRPWNLSLQSFCQHQVSGHGSAITSMAAHPQQPVAASLDAEGTVLLWALDPLQLLGPAFGPDQGNGLKHQDSMALLDSSMQQAFLDPNPQQPVQCAAICWLGLGEPAQEPHAVLACAMTDGAVKLLAVRTRSVLL